MPNLFENLYEIYLMNSIHEYFERSFEKARTNKIIFIVIRVLRLLEYGIFIKHLRHRINDLTVYKSYIKISLDLRTAPDLFGY